MADPTGFWLWPLQALHALTFAAGHLGAMAFIARAVPDALRRRGPGRERRRWRSAASSALGMALAAAVYPLLGGRTYGDRGRCCRLLGLGALRLLGRRSPWAGGARRDAATRAWPACLSEPPSAHASQHEGAGPSGVATSCGQLGGVGSASAANSVRTVSKRRWKKSAVSRKIGPMHQAAGQLERPHVADAADRRHLGPRVPAMNRRQAAGSTGSIGSSST